MSAPENLSVPDLGPTAMQLSATRLDVMRTGADGKDRQLRKTIPVQDYDDDVVLCVAALQLRTVSAEREALKWHGCLTGDCPHATGQECAVALAEAIRELGHVESGHMPEWRLSQRRIPEAEWLGEATAFAATVAPIFLHQGWTWLALGDDPGRVPTEADLLASLLDKARVVASGECISAESGRLIVTRDENDGDLPFLRFALRP